MVRGDGVAARACAYLLGCARETQGQSVRLPMVLVPAASQALFRQLFGTPMPEGMRIARRVVTWRGGYAEEFPHHGAVVSEGDLLRVVPSTENTPGIDWLVECSRPISAGREEHAFGDRAAWICTARIKRAAAPATCWIESTERGWLFLLPGADGQGRLIATGNPWSEQFADSRLVAGQIDSVDERDTCFPAAPAVVWPMAGRNWLACGSAALRFDPLCGDGVGHAIREAILAAAVVRAARRGEKADALTAHYQHRLIAGFRRHLEVCRSFYCSGGESAWWRAQLAELDRGISWCDQLQRGFDGFRYRLDGFELEPMR